MKKGVLSEHKKIIVSLAERYNNMQWFENDPVIFPRFFAERVKSGASKTADVEISGILAAHLAWGRREMVVRDCNRLFEEMDNRPYDYVMNGNYREDNRSLHRTIKWSDFARICTNLRSFYSHNSTLEGLTPSEIRESIYGQKPDKNAANKKIHMFRRWMVRNDGIVDLGIWKNISPSELIIPLDVHVHRSSLLLGITERKSADIKTAEEITEFLNQLFPGDPCKGDFTLFAYAAVTKNPLWSESQKND